MDSLRKSFHSIGFSSNFTLGLIDSRHILIRFDQQEDYLRCWKRGYWAFENCLMRVMKWHPNFSVDAESPLVPVWINLPLLPIHLYNKEALFSIARLIGEPLKIDAATESLSRPSQARVCIELDLMKERCEEVHITLGSFSYWQKIEFENIPHYCSGCHKIGHNKESCRKNEVRKHGTASQPATNKDLDVPKGGTRQEYRPKHTEIQHTPQPLETQNIVGKTENPEPSKVAELDNNDASLSVNSATPIPDAIVEDNVIIQPIPETANSIPTCNPPEVLENLPTLISNKSVPVQAPCTLFLTSAPTDIPSAPALNATSSACLVLSENVATEDVLELGEIPQAVLPYASDSESLQDDKNLPVSVIPTENPSSSNIAENRGKIKKNNTQTKQERISTRSSVRGSTSSQ